MRIAQFRALERTLWGASSTSKNTALQQAADSSARQLTVLNAKMLFRTSINHKRLGSAGLDDDIATPQRRINDCHKVSGTLITRRAGVDLEASDQYLYVLTCLTRLFNLPNYRQALRVTGSGKELYPLASTPDSVQQPGPA